MNNAGVVTLGNIETQTEEDYRFIMAVSADGTFFGCKHAVRVMKETGGGSIVNMASIASIVGEPSVAAYAAAKGAIESLTRSVAVHSAQNKYNIRCNSVHPAGILTPMVDRSHAAGRFRLPPRTPVIRMTARLSGSASPMTLPTPCCSSRRTNPNISAARPFASIVPNQWSKPISLNGPAEGISS